MTYLSLAVNDLIEQGIHKTTLPSPYGQAYSPLQYKDMLIRVARHNPALALSMSMHLLTVWGLSRIHTDFDRSYYFQEVSRNNSLFASPNDPVLYFRKLSDINPDKFPVKMTFVDGGVLVNGIRPYVSLEPFVQFLPIMSITRNPETKENEIVFAMVHKSDPGVSVKKDWDTISMSQTHSNTVELNQVFLPTERIISRNAEIPLDMDVFPYLFRIGICSVYFGVAKTAFEHVAQELAPSIASHASRAFGLHQKLAEMKILLDTSESQLIRFCLLAESYLQGEPAPDITSISLITKEYVLTSAERIVELAVDMMGIQAMQPESLLSKLYLDVKANTFHLPRSDVLKEIIAKQQLGVLTIRSRWC
ncbi:acyl-CoA dehydrogenase family protein [Paenibacillus methanolicus]|uniref:Alkylation response protein AidB-like acyl-CoA dehydrogenase n=1 Tax=Paenibacillus methanolicus TaxID=582686 RepID=A0A5S5C528_9BACL|nr:acyl-CoA dehydrogenase family protein [Paenibacillus methanolicus]TYP73073.1 alkylation response protein AidB-like acyl-CoA dehydrogenase [Paenibacillus methanolicus]